MTSNWIRRGSMKKNPIQWSKHKAWNLKMLQEDHYRKKSLRKIKNAIEKIRTELQFRNNDQSLWWESDDPLKVKGVIYAIVHLPSNKIYVGQTFQEVYLRFQQHWHVRHTSDGRNLNLHLLMTKQTIDNFLVVPLEMIDRDLYHDLTTFRRAATVRERFCIQRLQSIRPKGLNIYVPLGRTVKSKQRAWRPKNWTNSHRPNSALTACFKCYEKTANGKIKIHLHEGLDSHHRRTAQKWLAMTELHSDKDIELLQWSNNFKRSLQYAQ